MLSHRTIVQEVGGEFRSCLAIAFAFELGVDADAAIDAKIMSWSRLRLGRARRSENVKHAGTSKFPRGSSDISTKEDPRVDLSGKSRRRHELILRTL